MKLPLLRQFRKEHNLTQEEMGQRLNIQQRIISDIENGREVNEEVVAQFKKEFGAKSLDYVTAKGQTPDFFRIEREQKEYTTQFIKLVDVLLSKGIFAEQQQIAEWLGVEANVITNVRANRRDIPHKYFHKLNGQYGHLLREVVNNAESIPFVLFSKRKEYLHTGNAKRLSLPFIINPGKYIAFEFDDEDGYMEGEIGVYKKVSVEDGREEGNYIVITNNQFFCGKVKALGDVYLTLDTGDRTTRLPTDNIKELLKEKWRIIRT